MVGPKIWKQYSKYKDRNYGHYRNKYGGFKNILKNHNIEYIPPLTISKQEVIEKSIQLYKEYGYIDKILCQKNGISSSQVRRNFGGYNNLFKAINAPIKMPRGVSKEELYNDIEYIIGEYGVCSSMFYRKYGKYSETIVNKYGGWEYIMDELGYSNTRNSNPENIIKEYLKSNNYNYKLHYNFEWLKNNNGNKMFVDFYLPDINLVIEYDGEQHYKFVPYFHKTIEQFQNCVERDKLKESLIREHGIKIERILYYEDILDRLNKILH